MKTLNKFEDVIAANLALLGIGKRQTEIYSESGSIQPGSNQETDEGMHYLDMEYRLVLEIDGLPNESLSLLCLLTKYFVDGLSDRDDLGNVGFDFSPHNLGESQDVEITFTVRDPIYVVPVENSPVNFNQMNWGFGDGGLNVAEHIKDIHMGSHA